ncbi:glycosyl transferase group 1 [Solidesulfovibrio fructosivorans JJ]]|uniref:Glycosyl transferase group 1 n=2 Tax=Solidesulfovibrio fructosivorans TaxID=878 RepID=E1JY73_SOLFR|nr:glycosyl transferase group 1 [Solidesulfovibrio fructosivorans JJ]]
MLFFRKRPGAPVPPGFDLWNRPKVGIMVETTIPPVSRANLRMYWLAKALLAEKKTMVNMVSPSKDLATRRSYFVEWIWMNQFPGWAKHLYSKWRLPVRIWHFVASIISMVILVVWYKREHCPGFAVIHAWNPLAGLAAVIAGWLIRRPVFVDFTDFYSDIARTDMPLLSKPLVWLENFVLRQARHVFVVSNQLKEHLVRAQGLPAAKIHVVPDGTDSETFRPDCDTTGVRARLGIPEDAPVLVFHGDIKNDDGVDILIEAMAKVVAERPDARLLILGGGSPYFDAVCRPLIEKLGLADNVVLPGWIAHKDVPAVLCACDIGAMTLRATLNHDHYLSFKLFEYWGCGKPVVVTKLKAIGEIARDGENALIAQSGDVDGFARAFLRLIEDKDLAAHLGRAGRELVVREYDWREIMKKETAVYTSEFLGPPCPPSP